jgi:hypothetical protein
MENCDTHQRIEKLPREKEKRKSDTIFSVPLFYFKFYSPSLADSMSVSAGLCQSTEIYLSYYCLPGYENKIISQFDVSYFVRPTVEIQILSFKISGGFNKTQFDGAIFLI